MATNMPAQEMQPEWHTPPAAPAEQERYMPPVAPAPMPPDRACEVPQRVRRGASTGP